MATRITTNNEREAKLNLDGTVTLTRFDGTTVTLTSGELLLCNEIAGVGGHDSGIWTVREVVSEHLARQAALGLPV